MFWQCTISSSVPARDAQPGKQNGTRRIWHVHKPWVLHSTTVWQVLVWHNIMDRHDNRAGTHAFSENVRRSSSLARHIAVNYSEMGSFNACSIPSNRRYGNLRRSCLRHVWAACWFEWIWPKARPCRHRDIPNLVGPASPVSASVTSSRISGQWCCSERSCQLRRCSVPLEKRPWRLWKESGSVKSTCREGTLSGP